jgi:hypothetical protein
MRFLRVTVGSRRTVQIINQTTREELSIFDIVNKTADCSINCELFHHSKRMEESRFAE